MRALALAGALLLTPALAGCVDDATTAGADVVATFYPLHFVAERIAGDRLAVASLVPGGVEPHEWEPTAEAVLAVGGAKVVLRNGAGLDPWVDRLVRESQTAALVVDASDVVTLLDARASEPDAESPLDPHFWLDPILLANVTRGVAAALATVDPEGSETFTANADALVRDLETLDAEFETALASCNLREILTTHVAFTYLAKRYEFTQHGISGISPEDEPSAERIREIVEFARSRNITTVYHERLVSPSVAYTIATEIGGGTLPLDPIEGIPARDLAAGKTYFTLQRENLANLKLGMGCA